MSARTGTDRRTARHEAESDHDVASAVDLPELWGSDDPEAGRRNGVRQRLLRAPTRRSQLPVGAVG